MAKVEKTFIVYEFDEWGAEIQYGTVIAKSKGHVEFIMRKRGDTTKNISEIVEKKEG